MRDVTDEVLLKWNRGQFYGQNIFRQNNGCSKVVNPYKLNVDTMRLNFFCADSETIKTGIKRLGEAIDMLSNRGG